MNKFEAQIQPLSNEHLSAILELDKICFGGLWSEAAYEREIDSPNSEMQGLFCFNNADKLLGMGCFWSILEEAHITILAVNPQYHRQGIGAALLYSLIETARDRGLERATLEVRASNQAAISLYEKFGFKTAGKRRRYYQDNGEDALILWLGGIQKPDFPETLAKQLGVI
ncbi:ribosomal protein S18-alanine N-acetyltransferase [Rivularia sp. UHCC 0363]|uniref:ribosomal protein S18-alanine N-acetyltransferase n=1 Tax=Rivularia sp. UHCC 0363 TaxID=3110244 RepID=UPI002B1FA6D9|nr:ribosomal protein S18-alanine N-acetyltransferase [Rivularia sp. UHCC 0363]MEA5599406.1 ribosomal protein S18-alanine N-acetyltransferase [Rivularia sp. UHCC 0363]